MFQIPFQTMLACKYHECNNIMNLLKLCKLEQNHVAHYTYYCYAQASRTLPLHLD